MLGATTSVPAMTPLGEALVIFVLVLVGCAFLYELILWLKDGSR